MVSEFHFNLSLKKKNCGIRVPKLEQPVKYCFGIIIYIIIWTRIDSRMRESSLDKEDAVHTYTARPCLPHTACTTYIRTSTYILRFSGGTHMYILTTGNELVELPALLASEWRWPAIFFYVSDNNLHSQSRSHRNWTETELERERQNGQVSKWKWSILKLCICT